MFKVDIKNPNLSCSWFIYDNDIDETLIALNKTDDIEFNATDLVFKKSKLSESGRYGCVLKNNYGKTIANFELLVLSKRKKNGFLKN